MSTLWLIRHGPTHARAMVGWSDIPADLSDTAALSRLSDYLPQKALITSSDLIRATATADAIAGARQRIAPDPRLREIHFGDWEMQGFDQIEDQARARKFWEKPGPTAAPGGESWDQTRARVSAGTDALLANNPGADIIIVAHFGAILTQLQRALNCSSVEMFSHKIDNLSVTKITIADQWRAHEINHNP